MRQSVAAACFALIALTSTGCFPKKKQPAPAVAPAPQRPPVEIPPTKVEPPPPLEAPRVELPPQTPPQEPTVIRPKLEKVEPPTPPPAATKRKRPATNTKAAKPKDQPQTAVQAAPQQSPSPGAAETPVPGSEATPPPPSPLPAPAAPAPQLGEVMPDEKRRAYIASIEADLGAAQKVLREIDGKPLSRVQAENVNRVKAFVQQANDARSSDISGAVQLARRAAILADELAKSME